MFDFKIPKERPIKIEKIKVPKVYVTKNGDRTLTSAQKRKLKEENGFRCQKCGEKYEARLLEVHHKKSISSHKDKFGLSVPIYSWGKKYIPKYDRHKSNLEVVCYKCHDNTKKKRRKAKPIWEQY